MIVECRRVQSAAIRSAYAAALRPDGTPRPEKDVLLEVKRRFRRERVDAWTLHCAVQEAFAIHKRLRASAVKRRAREAKAIKDEARREAFLAAPLRYDPPVFGGRKLFERRAKKLITSDEFRAGRLMPFTTLGDKDKFGNRHFRLAPDARSCTFTMLTGTTKGQAWTKDKETGTKVRKARRTYAWTSLELQLPRMRGSAGKLLLQVAELAAAGELNVTFRLSATHLNVTFDPLLLPKHPERRAPYRAIPGRMTAIDMNPEFIGVAAVENREDPTRLDGCRILSHALIDLTDCKGVNGVVTREILAAACERILSLCAGTRCGTIVVEQGLGKLRSAGPSKANNRLINGWARTLLLDMLKRKAALRGIRVVEVWGGYSTTIGNVAFALPDACAAAAEMARRGLALDSPPAKPRRWRYAKLSHEEKAEREAAKAAKAAGKKHKDKPGVAPGVEKKETLPKFDPKRADPADVGTEDQDAAIRPRLPSDRLRDLVTTLRDAERSEGDHRWKEREGAGPGKDTPGAMVEDWAELHRRIKAAKFGVRRPHPEVPDRKDLGSAVSRLGRRRRGGTLFRRPPLPPDGDALVARGATDGHAVNPV